MDINDKIRILPQKERKEFKTILTDVLCDRGWCNEHSVDYVNPDITLVKERLYEELSKIRHYPKTPPQQNAVSQEI